MYTQVMQPDKIAYRWLYKRDALFPGVLLLFPRLLQMPALGAHWSRSVLFAALLLLDAAPFVAAEDALAKFGDKIPILGRVSRSRSCLGIHAHRFFC